MMENDVRFNAIGAISDLPGHLQQQLGSVMKKTGKNGSLFLSIALSYSGRRESSGQPG